MFDLSFVLSSDVAFVCNRLYVVLSSDVAFVCNRLYVVHGKLLQGVTKITARIVQLYDEGLSVRGILSV